MMQSKTRNGASASHQSCRQALLAAAAAAMPLIIASGSARAADVTWDGETDGLWATTTNWDTDAVPATGDDVIFATPTASNLTIAMPVPASGSETTVQSLTFNAGLTGPVTINTTNTSRLRVNGRSGDDVTVLGGNHVIAQDVNVSPVIGFRHGGSFSLNIAAGASLEISARLGATNSGNSFTKNGAGLLILSAGNGGSSGWNVSGGSGGIHVNGGILRMVGPDNQVAGNSGNDYTVNAGARLELGSQFGASNGDLTLNNGATLRAFNAGTRNFTAGGGAIRFTGGTATVEVDAGTTANFAQDISGAGTLLKTGDGTLRLADLGNTHTGQIAVNAGTLQINAADAIATSSAVDIRTGTTLNAMAAGINVGATQALGGSGTIQGNVTVAAGRLAPGMPDAAGTLTLGAYDADTDLDPNTPPVSVNGNVTFSGGGLALDLSGAAGGNDLLVVSGDLNLAAPSTVTVNRLDGTLEAGTYTVATYGTLTGDVNANLALPTVRQNLSWNTATPGQLDLVVGTGGSASLVWAGDAAANVWNTAGAANWLNGAAPDQFFDWDDVTFNDTGSDSPAVDIQSNVSPMSVTVSAGSKNYTFQGAGKLLAVDTLTKSGGSTLTLANADGNQIDAVAVNGGTLKINNVNTIGTLDVNSGGTLTFNNSTANSIGALNVSAGGTVNIGDGLTGGRGDAGASINNAGLVVYDRTDDFQTSTVISGAGNVEKKGPGFAHILSNQTYTGDTIIAAGTLRASTSASLGQPGVGTVTVADGATLDVGGFVGTAENQINFGQKQIHIRGTGVAAQGALYNSGTLRQFNAFQRVTLDADATIGANNANARYDIRAGQVGGVNNASLTLNGHTLTKIGLHQFSLVGADVDAGNIVINEGVFAIESTSVLAADPASTITMNNGTTLQFFNNAAPVSTVTRQVKTNGAVTIGNASGATQPSTIGAPIEMNGDITFGIVNNGAGALTMTGDITEIGGPRSITKTGLTTGNVAPTLTLTGAHGWTGNTTVTDGQLVLGGTSSLLSTGAMTIAPTATITMTADGNRTLKASAVDVQAGAKLDMTDNDMIVDYTGISPEFTLRNHVLAARDTVGGTSGIFFTRTVEDDTILAFGEASELGVTEFKGIAVDDTTVIGKYTYYGDANFDGQVTTDDYVAVDLGLGTGDSWVQGDFDLNGAVTTDDYVVVDLNLGKGTSNPLAYAEEQARMIALHTEMFGQSYVEKLAYASEHGWVAASVPEPGALSALGLGAAALLGRRRRRA